MHSLLVGIALLAVGLSTYSCLPVSSPSTVTHRVQSGNGKGNMIKAILDGRLQEHLTNRLTARFGGFKRPGPLRKNALSTAAAPATPAATGLGEQDYYDMFWLGNITIGTPAQGPFSMNFDTGSADLWVVDSTCGTGISTRTIKQCAASPQFNSSTSTSYSVDGTPFKIVYGDGSYAVGIQGVDTVTIADVNGNGQLVIPNSGIAQAYDVDRYTISSPMSGIFGLGFQSCSSNGIVPPIINAVQQGILPQSIFSVYLETESDETQVDAAPAGGTFTFGGLDSNNCGSVIDWIDLTTTQFWQFGYDSVNVGNTNIPVYGLDIISDTGTSLILGDSAIVKPIAKAVGAKSGGGGYFTVKCDATYNPVTFVINGNQYNLTSSVLTIDIGLGNNKCLFGMAGYDDFAYFMGIDWLMGDPFIRQYCAVHDVVKQQIGFAPATALQSS